MAADPAAYFAKLDKITNAEEKAGRKVIRSAEELRQLVAEKERQRVAQAAMVLNDKPPRKKRWSRVNMNDDPIVEEVRRVRDKLARQFNYDIHAIFADLRTRERMEDPAHPLIRDASEWAKSQENEMVLRDQPKRKS
jgi:hypothetical protein